MSKPTKQKRQRRNNTTQKRTHKQKEGRKWTTSIQSALNEYNRSGSVVKSREKLRSQSVVNLRRLFGYSTK